jgi:hypothetical protein
MYSPLTFATEGGGVAVGGAGVNVGGAGVGVLAGAKAEQAEMPKVRNRIERRLRGISKLYQLKIPCRTDVVARAVFPKQPPVYGIHPAKRRLPRRKKTAARKDIKWHDVRRQN